MSVIVIEFITVDEIVSDPDGSHSTPRDGRAFRHGSHAELACLAAEQAGPAVLTRYRRAAR